MGKKHLSVLMLYVRSSIIPLLGMLVLIGSIQTGLFLWRMNRGANSLEAVIQSAHLKAVLMSGFLLLAAFLYRLNGGGYTLRRLRISERAIFLWQSLGVVKKTAHPNYSIRRPDSAFVSTANA